MVVRAAFSPCPNDTYLVGGLAMKAFVSQLDWEFTYADIETLNRQAELDRYDVIKLSFFRYAQVRDRYALARVGAAIGYGVGPLLVARHRLSHKQLGQSRIGIPGFHTTAYSLLRYFLPEGGEIVEKNYASLMPAVKEGEIDAAVIIHEGRFTYSAYGLIVLADLGAYWTEKTGYPIPLGCLALRRDHPEKELIEADLKKSLQWARLHPDVIFSYVQRYAQEMAPKVIQAHIDLYVNAYTEDLTPAQQAIEFYCTHVAHFSERST
ncbi:MAG: 1,4-dihydroxy-6-naphthoate synthase [Bacteroidia bacterium]